jgi:hydrogenase small subunit
MKLSRRNFLKLVGAMGATAFLSTYKAEIVQALEEVKDYWHLCWLNGAACTGCTISFAQSADPDIVQILTEILVGDSGLPIALPDYMETIHPASGTLAEELKERWKKSKRAKILLVEGAVQAPGYCTIHGKDFREHLKECAEVADYIIAVGQCATFGGIPAAKPWDDQDNPTGAMGVQQFLAEEGINKTVINIPCCPAHPDHIVVTLACLMLGVEPELDRYGRPKVFFGKNMHAELCPYRPYYDRGIFITKPGEEGCRFKMGCKGPVCNTDCAIRKWNNGTSYCVEVGICIGCAEPGWPDKFSPFYAEVSDLPRVLNIGFETIGEGILGATLAGIAIHAVRHLGAKKHKKEEEKEE